MANRLRKSEGGESPRSRFVVGETVTDLDLAGNRWRIATTLAGMTLFTVLYRLLKIPDGFPHSYNQLVAGQSQQIVFTLAGAQVTFHDVDTEPLKHWPEDSGLVYSVDASDGHASVAYRRGKDILLLVEEVPVFAKQLIKDTTVLEEAGEYSGYDLPQFSSWNELEGYRLETGERAGETVSLYMDCTKYGEYEVLTGGLAKLQKPLALGEQADFDLAFNDWQTVVSKFGQWVLGQNLEEPGSAQELAALQADILLHQQLVDDPDLSTIIAPKIYAVYGDDWYAPGYRSARS